MSSIDDFYSRFTTTSQENLKSKRTTLNTEGESKKNVKIIGDRVCISLLGLLW